MTALASLAPTLNAPAPPDLHAAMTALPPAGAVALGVAVVVGVLLWLAGGKLARVACVVCGLAVGAAAGYVVGQHLKGQGAYVLPLVIGGGIAGALLAGLLFRVWVAIVGAAILAAVVPAAVLIWQGAVTITPTPANDKADATESAPTDAIQAPPHRSANADSTTPATTTATAYQQVEAQLHGFYDRIATRLAAQWDALDGSSRAVVYTGGLIGAAVGLGIGLVIPDIAAALQTALVGGVMLTLAGSALLRSYAPNQTAWLPDTPRALLLTLGLITLIGAAIQWTIFLRKTDK